MKMMKTAILTTAILSSASLFAGNASVNAGANAQVESGGVINRIGTGVKNGVTNTAHTVHSTASHATDATVNAGSHLAHKTHDVAVNAKDKTVNAAEKAGNKGEKAWKNTKQGTKNAVANTKAFGSEQKAKAESRYAAMKNDANAKRADHGVNAQSQLGVNAGPMNANAGVAANASSHNMGVKTEAVLEKK